MMIRQLKMTLRRLLSSLRPSCQLVLIVLSVLVVIWVLIILQRPLDAMASAEKDDTNVPRPMEYLTANAFETEIEIIYKQGFMGYNTSRIPALVYHRKTFLAFCEARKETFRDIGSMDLVVRRGKRNGWTVDWGEVIIVTSRTGYRVMNPTPIVDKDIEAIVLVFIAIRSHLSQWTMVQDGMIQQQVMVTRSFDNGLTWTHPQDITASTLGKMEIPPGIYAPGPGHGIQTSSGKLIVPGNYFVKDKYGKILNENDNFNNNTNYANVLISRDHGLSWHFGGHVPFDFDRTWRPIHTSEPMVRLKDYDYDNLQEGDEENMFDSANYANVIYSTDGGVNWHLGGSIPYGIDSSGWTIHSNEAMVVELQEDVLVLNTRTLHPDLPRVQSVSRNEGYTFLKGKLVPELIEPGYKLVDNETLASKAAGCQASLIGFPAPRRTNSQSTWVAFSNPASMFRERMSVRVSRDGCRTYTSPWTIYDRPSAYSDLTYFETTDPVSGLKMQNFAILFEGGIDTPYEKIMFKMFNLDAMLSGVRRTHMRPQQGSNPFSKV